MATTLNPSEISELIKNRIEKVKLAAESRNEGTVTSVSDGIVRIFGLADVMQGEMIELPNNTFGRKRPGRDRGGEGQDRPACEWTPRGRQRPGGL
ncbi:hypothetical protein ACQKD2_09785, partial [Stenotrophomonas sp. NPDC077426]